MGKIKHIKIPDYRVKISGKSNHHALKNLSSNTDVNAILLGQTIVNVYGDFFQYALHQRLHDKILFSMWC